MRLAEFDLVSFDFLAEQVDRALRNLNLRQEFLAVLLLVVVLLESLNLFMQRSDFFVFLPQNFDEILAAPAADTRVIAFSRSYEKKS